MAASRSIGAADIRQIAQIPLFDGFDPAVLAGLLTGATVRCFDGDVLLFSAGDIADRFYIVLDGRVRLFVLTADGQQGVVEVIQGVSSFAEAAMFSSRCFPVNAEAERGTMLVQVDAACFMRKLGDDKALALQMLANLYRWECLILDEIRKLKLKSPAQRLAAYMLDLTSAEDGAVRVRLPLRKAVLASRIGIEPESLSRSLQRLRALGVDCEGEDVAIVDVRRLREFCGKV